MFAPLVAEVPAYAAYLKDVESAKGRSVDGKTELEVNRYRECELTHGRVGMLAAVGFIVQERGQTPDKIRYDRAYCLRAPTVHPRFLLRWLFFSTYEGSAYHGSTYRVA